MWIKLFGFVKEKQKVPGTNGEYYLKNNEFIFETYDKEMKMTQILKSD